MTESEWLASDDTLAMLEWVRLGRVAADDDYPPSYDHCPVKVSGRKLRLFMAACCRLCPVHDEMYAVDVAERFADGLATEGERSRTHCSTVGGGAWAVCHSDVGQAALRILNDNHFRGREAELAALLREIVGSPFRPVKQLWDMIPNKPGTSLIPIPAEGADWLWNNIDAIESLAQAAYDERLPDGTLDAFRLALLADALEEAGCDSTEILRHLRGWRRCTACLREGGRNAHICECKAGGGWLPMEKPPACGPHVLGCWALDLVLGKG